MQVGAWIDANVTVYGPTSVDLALYNSDEQSEACSTASTPGSVGGGREQDQVAYVTCLAILLWGSRVL